MLDDIYQILELVSNSFLSVWPYLLLTIPLSVFVQISGFSKHINSALKAKPLIAILLATLIGAFSPFCSCGVIPIIAALLIGGVPLAPVMSFWIASPSMDPEIFFLSVATIGWELAIWRLTASLIISLSAGYITHFLIVKNIIDPTQVIKKGLSSDNQFNLFSAKNIRKRFSAIKNSALTYFNYKNDLITTDNSACCIESNQISLEAVESNKSSESLNNCNCNTPPTFLKRLIRETWIATSMVLKFMLLAFFITALINMYVPAELLTNLFATDSSLSVLIASIIGIPFYTSNLTALPVIGGLLSQGMNPGAALAFLIAGPTTTLPAMAAVWGITNRRVFYLYVLFSLLGSIIFGLLFNIFSY